MRVGKFIEYAGTVGLPSRFTFSNAALDATDATEQAQQPPQDQADGHVFYPWPERSVLQGSLPMDTAGVFCSLAWHKMPISYALMYPFVLNAVYPLPRTIRCARQSRSGFIGAI